jgi:hypothetical protein
MRTQPRSTIPGRRVALLVAAALLLGAGSVAFDAATAHAAGSIVAQETIRPYLYETPNRFIVGSVFRGRPVVVKVHDRSGHWARVVTDAGVRGWLRSRVVSRGARC